MQITKTELTRREYDGKYCLWALDEETQRWIILDVYADAKAAIEAKGHKNYQPEKSLLLS